MLFLSSKTFAPSFYYAILVSSSKKNITYLKIGYGYPTTGHIRTAALCWVNDNILPKVRSPTNFGGILLVGSEKEQ